ncbi:MAG: hypothetical protein RI590_05200 [Microbacteriaceae bacterium]|nr:hypothetical protein [Microbacteriaceae bacterium]MDR9444331.1 hypothetical protein [Microbacteriaceae bacterium]
MRKLIATTSIALITGLVLSGCATDAADDSVEENQASTSTTENLDSNVDEQEAEVSDIVIPEGVVEGTDAYLLWEALMGSDGEYAALASYQAVLDEYGDVEPYATIMEAEGRHADSLIRQLERLGVEVEENPYLGQIEAPADLETAAEAWAEGEILNVELYDQLIADAQSEQVIKVFNNLRSASLDSHLPAFELAAENGGVLTEEQMRN